MKYMKIYDVIGNYPQIRVQDRSCWGYSQPGYIALRRSLNIILEAPDIGLRIWVNHEDRRYSISTADLTLSCSSREYARSFQRYIFRNQRETAEKLESILSQEKERSHAEI